MELETFMESEIWMLLDRVMQWLIAPALGIIWWLNNRTSIVEREVMRILTILQERDKRRDEDRHDMASAVASLQKTIEKLDARLDAMWHNNHHGSGQG